MEALLNILKLVPYVAAGYSVIKTDLSLGEKTQAAQDGIAVAVAGATANLSPEHATLASKIGTLASDMISEIMPFFHHTTTAPAAVAPVVAETATVNVAQPAAVSVTK